MSPTQRTMARLKRLGYSCDIVERWVPITGEGYRGPIVRRDLFHAIDIVAVRPGELGILGVNATDATSVRSHIVKALSIPELRTFVECGNRFEVHGWSKRGRAGQPKRWAPRIVEPFSGRDEVAA